MASLKRRAESGGISGNPANISLEHVKSFWLQTDPPSEEKFLLLEDTDTGDVLMPLIYMKSILEANYSRKLASLKHREVQIPPNNSLYEKRGLLFWHWAFECPHSIKMLIREELGESTPQGHLRLVLLPIVYNAMAAKVQLRTHPLFMPLHKVMKQSNYWPLLIKTNEIEIENEDDDGGPRPKLFDGPKLVENTAMKYMFMFRTLEDMEASKRLRTTTNLGTESRYSTQATLGENGSPQQLEEAQGEDGPATQLLPQRPDVPSFKVPGEMTRDLSVPLDTVQLKNILENRFQDLMREIVSLKGSVLAIMQCLVSLLSDMAERNQQQQQHVGMGRMHPPPMEPPYHPNMQQGRDADKEMSVEQILKLIGRVPNANK